MASNADVNVIPAKLTTTGATTGYLKTTDGANSFEVVSSIPAADVNVVSKIERVSEAYTLSNTDGGTLRILLANGAEIPENPGLPELSAYVAKHFTPDSSGSANGTYPNLPYVWMTPALPAPPTSSGITPYTTSGICTYQIYTANSSDRRIYLLITPASGGFLTNVKEAPVYINWWKVSD